MSAAEGTGRAWRKPALVDRQLAWLWAGAAAAALALVPLWRVLARFLPLCVFRTLTGVPCPTCGATRASLALLDLDPLAALAHNPLVTLAALGFLAGLATPLWLAAGGRVPTVKRLPGWARVAIVAAMVANWAWVIWRG